MRTWKRGLQLETIAVELRGVPCTTTHVVLPLTLVQHLKRIAIREHVPYRVVVERALRAGVGMGRKGP